MKVNALLFGIARDIIGSDKFECDLNSGKTVFDLRVQLLKDFPSFENLNSVMIAVNNEYADDALTITSTDEVAIIPPVSGG